MWGSLDCSGLGRDPLATADRPVCAGTMRSVCPVCFELDWRLIKLARWPRCVQCVYPTVVPGDAGQRSRCGEGGATGLIMRPTGTDYHVSGADHGAIGSVVQGCSRDQWGCSLWR